VTAARGEVSFRKRIVCQRRARFRDFHPAPQCAPQSKALSIAATSPALSAAPALAENSGRALFADLDAKAPNLSRRMAGSV